MKTTTRYSKNKEVMYIYDYTKEIEDDKELQDILIMSENLLNMKINSNTENIVLFCIDFLSEKIDYIYNISESFGFKIRPDRMTTVGRVLDTFTTEKYRANHLDDAELKISLILDLLSSSLTIFTMFYQYNFESKN